MGHLSPPQADRGLGRVPGARGNHGAAAGRRQHGQRRVRAPEAAEKARVRVRHGPGAAAPPRELRGVRGAEVRAKADAFFSFFLSFFAFFRF